MVKLFSKQSQMKNLVIVDVQPFYKPWFTDNLLEYLVEAIEQAENVIWYFNGEEVCIEDSQYSICEMMEEYLGREIEKLQSVKFIEKGYGFLRNWMDRGEDDYEIVETLKLMEKSGVNDSRELDDYADDDDCITFPNLDKPQIDSCFICGGGEYECLAEMELMFRFWGIEAKKLKQCVY